MAENVTFEEEEEGTGIASDVVKVEGEDPATPGLLPSGIDPGTVTIPQYRYNKIKQHTHNIDKLNSQQNIPLCSSVWSRLSVVFLWEFAGCLPSPT